MSAWVKEDQISLGQMRTSEKSNEITAILELLRLPDVRGAVVTIDAMIHTGHAPENFSLVRKIAKALLQNEKTFKTSAPRKSKRASYMPDYARLNIGFPAIDFK